MGTKTDMLNRTRLPREDTSSVRDWLEKVRKFIFGGWSPESNAVRATLVEQLSMTPTQVRLLSPLRH